jgi:enoyl-CoA hydratase/carnithine racemase
MTSAVEIDNAGPVRILTMRNDGKLNAFDAPMLLGLVSAIADAETDPTVRVLILTGAGSSFCSGGDTSTMGSDPSPRSNRDFLLDKAHQVPLAIRRSPLPVIAMINGAAVGAGLDIALACDLRTCADDAVLLEGYVRAGLAAGDGGAWLLPRLIGAGRAADLLLTARRISATEAHAIGLVTQTHPAADLRDATLELAATLASHPPQALAEMKRLLHQNQTVGFETGLQLAADTVAVLQAGQEHHDAVARLRSR